MAALAGVLTVGVLAWAIPLVQVPPALFRGRNFYGAVGEFATPLLDLRTLVFTAALRSFTILLFGLLPAWRTARSDVAEDLRSGGTRTSTRGGMLSFARTASAMAPVDFGCNARHHT